MDCIIPEDLSDTIIEESLVSCSMESPLGASNLSLMNKSFKFSVGTGVVGATVRNFKRKEVEKMSKK